MIAASSLLRKAGRPSLFLFVARSEYQISFLLNMKVKYLPSSGRSMSTTYAIKAHKIPKSPSYRDVSSTKPNYVCYF